MTKPKAKKDLAAAQAKADEEKAAEDRRRATEERDAADARAKADEERRVKALADAAAAKKKLPRIAEGCSLTSKRGILGPGEYVYPNDFQGGQETIDAHIGTGHIIAGK